MAAPTYVEVRNHVREHFALTMAETLEVLRTPLNPAGMRDEFAVAALQSPQLFREGESVSYDEAARAAYQLADAMLEARNANR